VRFSGEVLPQPRNCRELLIAHNARARTDRRTTRVFDVHFEMFGALETPAARSTFIGHAHLPRSIAIDTAFGGREVSGVSGVRGVRGVHPCFPPCMVQPATRLFSLAGALELCGLVWWHLNFTEPSRLQQRSACNGGGPCT